MPISETFAPKYLSLDIKMFWGFKPRCIIPNSCKWTSPETISLCQQTLKRWNLKGQIKQKKHTINSLEKYTSFNALFFCSLILVSKPVYQSQHKFKPYVLSELHRFKRDTISNTGINSLLFIIIFPNHFTISIYHLYLRDWILLTKLPRIKYDQIF